MADARPLLGMHVSKGKDFAQAVANALHFGCESFGLFLSGRYSYTGGKYTAEDVQAWHAAMKDSGIPYTAVLPHAAYSMNLAREEEEPWEEGLEKMVGDMHTAHLLGIPGIAVHSGTCYDEKNRSQGVKRVAEAVTKILRDKRRGSTKLYLEMMNGSKAGGVLGDTLENMREIIDAVDAEVRGDVGVVLDTAHLWGAGYDISTKDKAHQFFDDFDRIIGFDRLAGCHLNDSKTALGAHADHHEDVGHGTIPLEGLAVFCSHTALNGLPVILESMHDYKQQILVLKMLRDGQMPSKSDLNYNTDDAHKHNLETSEPEHEHAKSGAARAKPKRKGQMEEGGLEGSIGEEMAEKKPAMRHTRKKAEVAEEEEVVPEEEPGDEATAEKSSMEHPRNEAAMKEIEAELKEEAAEEKEEEMEEEMKAAKKPGMKHTMKKGEMAESE